MSHFATGKIPARPVPDPDWLAVGSQLGACCNDWAKRNDIVAFIGPRATSGPAAQFSPYLAEMFIDTIECFGEFTIPDEVKDFATHEGQNAYPQVAGAVFHEAMHARFTRWDLKEAAFQYRETPAVYEALHLLEEGRIEYYGMQFEPEMREHLRSCVFKLVLADALEPEDPDNPKPKPTRTAQLAHLAALSLGRVDAGVLEPDDIVAIRELLDERMDPDVLEQLRSIWVAFQNHKDHANADPVLYELAEEWVKVVTEASQNDPEPEPDALQELMQAIAEALSGDSEGIMIEVREIIAEENMRIQWEKINAEKTERALEREAAKEAAEETFPDDRDGGPNPSTGHSPAGPTRSKLLEKRPPSPAERQAAAIVGQLLEKAKYRERDNTAITSQLPPGRLISRAVVQREALKSQGRMTGGVQPFRRSKRTQTEEPTLSIGILADISGSQTPAMEPTSVATWVIAEAAHRIQATAATVYFGEGVFPTLYPGGRHPDIRVYSAKDRAQKFDAAFRAVDGALNLLHGSGARLLVVSSDAVYSNHETNDAARWLTRCYQEGVAVLWLAYTADDGDHSRALLESHPNARLLVNPGSVTDAALEIGRAAAASLEAVGRRNAA